MNTNSAKLATGIAAAVRTCGTTDRAVLVRSLSGS
jgi:hypothetical protein